MIRLLRHGQKLLYTTTLVCVAAAGPRAQLLCVCLDMHYFQRQQPVRVPWKAASERASRRLVRLARPLLMVSSQKMHLGKGAQVGRADSLLAVVRQLAVPAPEAITRGSRPDSAMPTSRNALRCSMALQSRPPLYAGELFLAQNCTTGNSAPVHGEWRHADVPNAGDAGQRRVLRRGTAVVAVDDAPADSRVRVISGAEDGFGTKPLQAGSQRRAFR